MTDHQLLDMRLCDLPVRIKGTRIEQRVTKLYRDLDERGLRFHPHVWLSEEWFTPDGTPGFAIPFRLAPEPVLLAYVLSFVVTATGTLLSTWRAATAPPMEAMR